MDILLWAVAVSGIAIALLSMRRSSRLAEEIKKLKRDQYDADSRLKRISHEIKEAVEPLRVHLAKVATGGTVSREIILDGRLYWEISADQAHELLERDSKAVVVDVRTLREYGVRRLAGARLVPFEELEKRYQEIPEDAGKVLIYCASGERSRLACDFLSRKGYTNLYLVLGGIQSWNGPTEGEGELNLIQIRRKE
jgi:phage shock protein E